MAPRAPKDEGTRVLWEAPPKLSVRHVIHRAIGWRVFGVAWAIVAAAFVREFLQEMAGPLDPLDLIFLAIGSGVFVLLCVSGFLIASVETDEQYPVLLQQGLLIPTSRWVGWRATEMIPWEDIESIKMSRMWFTALERPDPYAPGLTLRIRCTDGRERVLSYIGGSDELTSTNRHLESFLSSKWEALRSK